MTRILKEGEIADAVAFLKRGEIVAFPTETVYGLGACLSQPLAISKIFAVKGRPQDNPLIVHVSHREQVEQIAQNIPSLFYSLAERFFPGPLTLVLEKRECVPSIVSGGLSSVAVRMPCHPLAHKLIEAVAEPLVAPSANLSGKPSSTCCAHVLHDFAEKIAAIIDGGDCHYGIESTVVSLLQEEIVLLRPGAISLAQIEQVVGRKPKVASHADLSTPLSPGVKYRHYAPDTPLLVLERLEDVQEILSHDPDTRRMLLSCEAVPFPLPPSCHRFALQPSCLYGLLRHADTAGYQQIIIFCDPVASLDLALRNRIEKASALPSLSEV